MRINDMKTRMSILAALAVAGSVLATPAAADCLNEIAILDESINSALIDVSGIDRDVAKAERDTAMALCEKGYEAEAAFYITNAWAFLGK